MIGKQHLSDPAQDAFLVTPADSDFASGAVAVALLIGTGGNVRVTTVNGTDIVIPVTSGFLLPLSVTRVWSTNTTASNIVALV